MLQVVLSPPLPTPHTPFTNKRGKNPCLSLKHLVTAPGQELPWLPSPHSSWGNGSACCFVFRSLGCIHRLMVVAWGVFVKAAWSGLSLYLSHPQMGSAYFNCLNGVYTVGWVEGSCFFFLSASPFPSIYLSRCLVHFTLLPLLWFHSSGRCSSSGSEGKLKTHPGR